MISRELLDSYLLLRDMKPSTETYYRRIANVYNKWAKGLSIKEFTPRTVSEFLATKQRSGKSSHYRRSLRSGLRALLTHSGASPAERVRPVKTDQLDPEAWTADEVMLLVNAVPEVVKPVMVDYWQQVIVVAYYTGASQIDIHELSRKNFFANGRVRYVRSKTGKLVTTAVPPEFVRMLPSRDPCWPLKTSREFFRVTFGKIVARARLKGTFKKLRKSSGTSVDILHPGMGHKHLGNSRKIFETHYFASKMVEMPIVLPAILPEARR